LGFFHCFSKCNKNLNSCKIVCANFFSWLLYTYLDPFSGSNKVNWFDIRMTYYTHACGVHFSFVGTNTMVTFKLLFWILISIIYRFANRSFKLVRLHMCLVDKKWSLDALKGDIKIGDVFVGFAHREETTHLCMIWTWG
jgi:hypothetical protein